MTTRVKWNEDRLNELVAHEGQVRERLDDLTARMWEASPANRDAPPDEAELRQRTEDVASHAFLSRELENAQRAVEQMELARPQERAPVMQDSLVARWAAGGPEALSGEERQAHAMADLRGSSPAAGITHPRDVEGMRLPKGAHNADFLVIPMADLEPHNVALDAMARRTERLRAVAPGVRPDEATGGELWTPTHVYPMVGQRLAAFGGVERGCTIWNSPDGVAVRIPTADDSGAKGEILGNTAGPITEDEVETGNREINTVPGSSKKMNLSIFMDADSPINVDMLFRTFASRRLARAWAEQWISGDGTNDKPRGILTDAQRGVDGTTELGPTSDELFNLIDSVDIGYMTGEGSPYGLNPPMGDVHRGFVMHQSGLRELRKLTGSDGHFLWMPGLDGPASNQIAGYPYIVDNEMPAPPLQADSAQQRSLVFGNFGYYMIRKAPFAVLARFWDSGTVSTMSYQYVAFNRCGGRPMGGFPNIAADPTEAFKYYITLA